MKQRISLAVAFLATTITLKAQNLFPEQFTDCALAEFCLDCGDTKGIYSGDLNDFFAHTFQAKDLQGIEGTVFIQLLVDTQGKQCVISMGSQATGGVDKLNLRGTINAMKGWKPAYTKGKAERVSITLRFDFHDQRFNVSYDRFDPTAVTNMKSEGQAEITNPKPNAPALLNEFTVYTTENSVIPWDMTRAICVDHNNVVWLGTDNGIVRIEKGKFSVINGSNSPLRSSLNQINIMNADVDVWNNKWFNDGYTVYKYNGSKWELFDSLNSPIKWTTGIYADKVGNVWFSGFDGLIKYDGKQWSVMNKANSKLPSDRIMGVFVDSKKRLWVGTDSGNVRFDGAVAETFRSGDNPLKTAALTKGYEDKGGTIWFSLYEEFPQKKGFASFSPTGQWKVINTANSNIPRNDVLDFAVNEHTNTVWLSINRVGLSEYAPAGWATFTPDNSKVPSTYIQSIAFDQDGTLWCATFAGLLKVVAK